VPGLLVGEWPSITKRLLGRQPSELGAVSDAVQGGCVTAGAGHLLRCAKAVSAALAASRAALCPFGRRRSCGPLGRSRVYSCALLPCLPGEQHLVDVGGREKLLAKTRRHAAPEVTALQVCDRARLPQPRRRAVPCGRGLEGENAGGRARRAARGGALRGAPRGAAAAAHVQEVRVGEAGRGAPRRSRARTV